MKTTTASHFRAGACAVALLAGLAASAASAQSITLLSGSAGGTWTALSGTLKSMLEREVPGMDVRIRPGVALANIKGVSAGMAEIGWMLADSANDALAGRPPFGEPVTNLCEIAAFHPTVLHFMTTDPDVEKIADIAGHRVGTLPRGSGSDTAFVTVLGLSGLDEDDVQRDFAAQGDLPNMMKDGHIDVWSQLSGVPGGAVADLFSSSGQARFLPISDQLVEDLHAVNPAWRREIIPAGTYPGQDEEVGAVGFLTHIGANCDTLSEEDAYAITKTLIANYAEMGSVNHSIGQLSVPDLARDVGLPLHPGARRAYEEAGAL
ncbi:TAXI family TRAP transporter solute-binding subunit [Mangrovicoccus ximenensis]|uniref:TAXI family TRAP transporter solute-binding subunit n=1 Tax=Mangrovicoccus ximenensis TaxID=1911570 RepID=UPI001374B441|nr:TAXI family TRAP transporter solute-binding subunit [Mangrovicoccus ximenensis]